MNLEIANYILSSYHAGFETQMELIADYIEDGSLDAGIDVEDLAWGNSYSQLENLIYDDLEYEFEFDAGEFSLDELIHMAEEVVTQM